jgi:hypothetical protein
MDTAFDACRAALSEAETADELNAAYAGLAQELSRVLLGSERQVRLYLQESRGPADPARDPIRKLADKITERSISLTKTANERGLIRDLPAAVTAIAVVGAVEGMLVRQLSGHQMGDPLTVTMALISMVLEGIRAR